MNSTHGARLLLAAILLGSDPTSNAWDYPGHRLVNQLALASLPTNYPAFARTPAARGRIAFLAGEPDRWRNTPDLPLKHRNGPDHYIDIEDLALAGLDPKSLKPFRYEFAAQWALARANHPTNFPAIDPARNEDRTREWVGFLPWTITEHYAKLKSAFSYLKVLEELGTPEEIVNAQQNIIYVMGVMGHFVGDASQPLHTTRHFNGWVGPNPQRYAANTTFHAWVDGGYIQKIGLRLEEMLPRLRPARALLATRPAAKAEGAFPQVMAYILDQYKLVEPLYQLVKDGNLSDEGGSASKGRAFMTQQLLAAGEMLGDLWYSAWQQAPPDNYLRGQLIKRNPGQANRPATPKP